MSFVMPQDICRLCLGRDNHLFSLQDPVLARMIWECTTLEVLQNDSLPQSICKTCFASTEFCHQFRKQCLKSDEILLKCVANGNTSMLLSLMDDVVTKENPAKDIKLEEYFSTNSNLAIEHEQHAFKEEKEDNTSYHSGIDDYDEYVVNKPDLGTKMVNSIKKEKKVPSKSKGKQKERESKTLKSKEKKMPTQRKPRKSKLKDMPLQRFQCDFCGRTFKTKQHFLDHVRIHTGEKPYTCEICQKKFSVKHNLQTHHRTHTRERPYSCIYCSKRFIDNSAKYRHQKIHTNDKKHPCPHCTKRFMTKYDLNKHVVRHTGGKFYECTICFQSYADASSLNDHKKMHDVT